MKNSQRLNVCVSLSVAMMATFIGCTQGPCEDRISQREEDLVRVKGTLTYDDAWQEPLADKLSDLLGFIENTWELEARLENGLHDEHFSSQVALSELRNVDMFITLARKRVTEIDGLVDGLSLNSIASDRMRDRLRRLDRFLMQKEVLFNELRTQIEDNPDVSFTSQPYKPHLPGIYSTDLNDSESIENELNGLQMDLFSAQNQLTLQQTLLDSILTKMDSQEVVTTEMRHIIRLKEMALIQSDSYRANLRKDIGKLEKQRMDLIAELQDLEQATKLGKAEIFLNVADDLFLQLEDVKGKKNKELLSKLALDFYEKSKSCDCLDSLQVVRLASLEQSLME